MSFAAMLLVAPCLVNDGAPTIAAEYCPAAQIARRQCLEIADRLASVRRDECDAGFRITGNRSVEGRALLLKEYTPRVARAPRARVLLLGGIHGDELASVSVVFKWMEILDQHHSGMFHWRIVPALNPDGLLRTDAQRVNANGVDLNRNFPTPNWSTEALIDYWQVKTGKDARRYPGERPLSEPESRWLVDEINRFQPDAIVSVHAPFGIVDFDGPSQPPDQIGHLHLNLLGTYPGSLGNFAGVQHDIPVITVELPYAGIMPTSSQISAMWRDLVRWLYDNISAEKEAGSGAQESPS